MATRAHQPSADRAVAADAAEPVPVSALRASIPCAGLIGALAKALPELESAKKNKANPAFKSKYADLAAVIEALEPLKEHGLWYRQHVHESAEGVMIETLYLHESGEQLSAGCLFMPAAKRDAQGFGSALTYARRYSLQTAFGLATEDDDGNAASKRNVANDANGHAPERINDAEWAMLVQLIETTGTDTAKLCQAYKAGSLREFTTAQFADAKRILEKRLANKKEPAHA